MARVKVKKMADIIRWLTRPSAGGVSDCLDRGKGNCLPNCVGLCFGLFYFLHGEKPMEWRAHPRCNANGIYEACKKKGSGFWVQKAVKANSILCFNTGENGHVVYCLGKLPDGTWLCLESNYSGTLANGRYFRAFATKTPQKLYTGYQGCVYDFT